MKPSARLCMDHGFGFKIFLYTGLLAQWQGVWLRLVRDIRNQEIAGSTPAQINVPFLLELKTHTNCVPFFDIITALSRTVLIQICCAVWNGACVSSSFTKPKHLEVCWSTVLLFMPLVRHMRGANQHLIPAYWKISGDFSPLRHIYECLTRVDWLWKVWLAFKLFNAWNWSGPVPSAILVSLSPVNKPTGWIIILRFL